MIPTLVWNNLFKRGLPLMKTMVSFLCYDTLNAICLPYDAAAVYWQ